MRSGQTTRFGMGKRGADALPFVLHVLHRFGVEEELDDVVFDALPHVLEESKGLAFVFDQGVTLAVCPETDAFAQVVKGQQVVLPLPIDGVEQKKFFETGKLGFAELVDPGLVVVDGGRSDQTLRDRVG